jgi:hypothetical protein
MQKQYSARPLQEISSIQEVLGITKSIEYPVAIFNSIQSKWDLLTTAGRQLQDRWHLVRLTRRNKVSHFISHYFWSLNSRDSNTDVEFGHNNTDHIVYVRWLMQQPPVHMPIDHVMTWLQEQLIMYHVPYHSVLDYDDLPHYQGTIAWTPNRYQGIGLEHLFSNHAEISDVLTNFTSTVYP